MTQSSFSVRRNIVDGVDAVVADSAHRFARHTHDQFGFGVIERGAQRSHSGRGQVEAGPGDLITVNPGEVHDGEPIGGTGRRWCMLYASPDFFARHVDELASADPRHIEFVDPVFQHASTARLFRRLFSGLTGAGDMFGPTERETLVMMLVAGLTHRAGGPAEDGVPSAVRLAISRIDDDPSAPVTLADLSETAGLSRFQVVRGVFKATGLTPHAYIVQKRLDAARGLIAAGQSLADVAAGCGFADQSHFTRSFVRRFGFTPGRYAAAQG